MIIHYSDNAICPGEPLESSNAHIPGLDGLRGLAVALVFLSHAQLGVPGRFGPFGVTIFFFLSGFLITTLLQREFDKFGSISVSDFYKRRFLRIVPPMLITISIVSAISLLRGMTSPSAQAYFIQAFSFTNYYIIFRHYSHGIPNMQPMWSLSVEEHFYFVYPFVFALMYRKANVKALTLVLGIAAIAVASFRCWEVWQLRPYWHDAVAERTIYKVLDIATHTRIDSIIYGCLFALLANPVRGSRFTKKLNSIPNAIIGMILLVAGISAHYIQESIGYVLLGAAFIPLFTVLILQSRTGWLRFFESPVMLFMGSISYTFYLIHVFVLMSIGSAIHSHVLCAAVSFALSIAYSTAMLWLVERPIAVRRRLITHG